MEARQSRTSSFFPMWPYSSHKSFSTYHCSFWLAEEEVPSLACLDYQHLGYDPNNSSPAPRNLVGVPKTVLRTRTTKRSYLIVFFPFLPELESRALCTGTVANTAENKKAREDVGKPWSEVTVGD